MPAGAKGFTILASLVLFGAASAVLAAGTPYLVKDIHPSASSAPDSLTRVENRVFFNANDGVHGRELWVRDGTALGTYMVFDLVPGPGSGGAFPIRSMGGRAFYHASNAAGEQQLWVTDGKPEGTMILISINQSFSEMEALGGLMMFAKKRTGSNLTELWRTTGSPQETAFVKEVDINQMTSATGASLFFAGLGSGSAIPGFDLWKTDGTSNGTQLLADLRGCLWITPFNDGAVFQADSDPFGREPWYTDGTSEGTALLKDIHPGPGFSTPNCFHVFNGLLYFNAFEPSTGREIWRSDSTSEGTELFVDVNPGVAHGGGCEFTEANGILFFSAFHPSYGRELWKTDGSIEGTVLVKDIREGPQSSDLENLVASSGKLYFRANDGIHGFELWVSDGSEDGTRMVRDIAPGPDWGLQVFSMVDVDGLLFFVGSESEHASELWALDTRSEPIPTTSTWGLICFCVVLLAAGSIVLRVRSRLELHWRTRE